MTPTLFSYFCGILGFLAAEAARRSTALQEDFVVFGRCVRHRPFWLTFLLVDILGLCFSLADLKWSSFWLQPLAIACFLITLAGAGIVIAVKVGGIRSSQTPRLAIPSRLRRMAGFGAGVGAFVGAFALGTLVNGDDTQQTLVLESPYHVEGTDTNGSGFVNVCGSPAPCAGKDPIGRLNEGDPVPVDCQLKGRRVESLSGRSSYIWDRLVPEGFVSDLYVSTPRVGRFSSSIPRCSEWE